MKQPSLGRRSNPLDAALGRFVDGITHLSRPLERVNHELSELLRRPVYALYTRRLRAEVMSVPRPGHIAVIMDGNRRWAADRGFEDVGVGHRRGAEKALELVDWCAEIGIREVTLWALSLENLERGRIGALSVADFRVTSPRSREPVFSVADTRFAGLDGGKMLAAMSVASWMPGMPVGRPGLDQASASGFGGELLTRFGISLEGITADFDHSTPKLMRGRTRISNFVLAPPLRGLEALQIRLAMTAMGLREARLDFDCSGTEDRSRRELAIDRCALTGRDLAEVDFTMKVVDAGGVALPSLAIAAAIVSQARDIGTTQGSCGRRSS